MLRVLSKQCQGCTLSDLHSSHVYSKYFLRPGGAQPGGLGLDAAPSECAESLVSKKPKKDPPAAKVPAPAPPEKSDCQLFTELLRAEGLACPEMAEEKAKGTCRLGKEPCAAVAGCWALAKAGPCWLRGVWAGETQRLVRGEVGKRGDPWGVGKRRGEGLAGGLVGQPRVDGCYGPGQCCAARRGRGRRARWSGLQRWWN